MRFTWLLILLAFACSKDDDAAAPAATGGCTVTFKGTTYTFNIAVCVDPTAGSGTTVDGLSAANTTGTQGFVIARDTSDPTFDSITITTNTADATGGSTYSASVGLTSQPSITRNGKSWSFNGTAAKLLDNADTGAISGNCTCTN